MNEPFRPAVAVTDLYHRGVLIAEAGATVQAHTVVGGDSRALVEIDTVGEVVAASPYDIRYTDNAKENQ